MSLTVRQISQISPAFKQQLDTVQSELDNNDAIADRLKELFKSSNPQIEALSTSITERQDDLKHIRGMCNVARKKLDELNKTGQALDQQTFAASRLSESINSTTSFSKVAIVPSTLSDNTTKLLEERTGELERSITIASQIGNKLLVTDSVRQAVEDLYSKVL